MKERLIELLRNIPGGGAWALAIKQFLDTKPDLLIDQLRAQAIDDEGIMCNIIGEEATQLLFKI